MAQEVYGLLGIAATAAGISLVFDLLRVIRASTGLPHVMTDGLFWLLAAFGMTAALLYFNNGQLRGYEIVGAVIGSVLYFSTISRWVVKGFTVIFKIFLKNLYFICKILLTPTHFLYKILYRMFHKMFRVRNIKKNEEGNLNEH